MKKVIKFKENRNNKNTENTINVMNHIIKIFNHQFKYFNNIPKANIVLNNRNDNENLKFRHHAADTVFQMH